MYMAASIVYNVRRAPWTRYIGLAAVGTSSNNVPYSRPASTIDRAATGPIVVAAVAAGKDGFIRRMKVL